MMRFLLNSPRAGKTSLSLSAKLRDSLFPLLKRWLREPLLHFLLIGICGVRCLRLHASRSRRSRVVEADCSES